VTDAPRVLVACVWKPTELLGLKEPMERFGFDILATEVLGAF